MQQSAEEALVSFFEQIVQKDKAQLNKLRREQCFSVKREHWYFSLPDLYLFLQRQNEVFSRIDYRHFRQLIFNSNINQVARLHGAEIIIVDNRNKVDQSCYALVWQSEA